MEYKIQLSRGAVATVDKDDYAWLIKWKWFLSDSGYAVRSQRAGSTNLRVYMHREIMRAGPEEIVDHIDGDKLNARKENMRLCTQAENMANAKRPKDNLSGYKDVCWSKHAKRWAAKVGKEHLGYYFSAEDAARSYDRGAKRIYGKFARLNFPDK